MRVLLLTHRIPFPPNKGDKIRAFNVLRYLAARHAVDLVTLIDDAADLASVASLTPMVGTLLHDRIDEPMRRLWSLRAMLRAESVTVRHFYSERLQRELDRLVAGTQYDAVLCSSSPMAEYVLRSAHAQDLLATPVKIMDLIDVDSYKWRQYADASPVGSAWIYRHEARTLAAYERRIYRTFDHLLVVSEQEKRYFPQADDAAKLHAMPNGVDLEYFAPGRGQPPARRGPTIVFSGVLDYWPNVAGMRWFVEHVYPLVRRGVPDVVLYVVGARPVRAVRAWHGRDNIIVTGFVPDVRDYLAAADVCVIPLNVARGIQNKLLEAMAMGKAAVATPQAFEGTHAAAGRDVRVADGRAAFADAVVDLLRDPAAANELGRSARRCVEQNYAWDRNLRLLEQLLAPSTQAARAS